MNDSVRVKLHNQRSDQDITQLGVEIFRPLFAHIFGTSVLQNNKLILIQLIMI